MDTSKQDQPIGAEEVRKYVFGELPDAYSDEVANAISQDPVLQEIEEEYDAVRATMVQARTAELLQRPRPKQGGKKWYYLIAALFVGFLVFCAYQLEQHSTENILRRQAEPPPAFIIAGQDDSPQRFRAGRNAFAEADYQRARTVFQSLVSDSTYGSRALFFLPFTAFYLENYPTAATEFATALALPEDELNFDERYQLRWHAMLTRLALGEDIRQELEEGDWEAEDREPLQQELDSFWWRY